MANQQKPKIVLYAARHTGDDVNPISPMGLLALSSILDQEGYPIKIYNIPVTHEQLLEETKDALVLGISSFTGHGIKDGLAVSRLVKEKNPNINIIWGGFHVSANPEQALENDCIDFVIKGQGSRVFPDLLHAIESGSDFRKLQGVCYREHGRVIINDEGFIEDINNFPRLPYHLVNMEKTIVSNQQGKRVIHYISSVGCPWRCSFCADPLMYKRRWSALKPERVVEDWEFLVKTYGIDAIQIDDDNFFVNEKRVREIFERLIAKNLKINFFQVSGRSDELGRYSKETWELMRKGGITSILNGAESGDNEVLAAMHKDITRDQTLNLARIAAKHEIKVIFSVMIGYPTEKALTDPEYTRKEIYKNMDFIDELVAISPKHFIYLFVFTPYEGAPVNKDFSRYGISLPTDLNKWDEYEIERNHLPWVREEDMKLHNQIKELFLPFLTDEVKIWAEGKNNLMINLLYKSARSLLKFRWKHRFFKLPVEHYLFSKTKLLLDKRSLRIKH